jgi:hypothetical protein
MVSPTDAAQLRVDVFAIHLRASDTVVERMRALGLGVEHQSNERMPGT